MQVKQIYDPDHFNKVAFELGWDCAIYGIDVTDVPEQVIEGFRAAKAKGITTKKSDKYINKYLYIRLNAIRRNRIVADHVSPDMLRRLDGGRCPITRMKFTYGTGTETDWSVDRVNNKGAYAAMNICIMSVKANAAKGSMNSQQIYEIYERLNQNEDPDFDKVEYNGLNVYEWERLAWLTQRCDEDPYEGPVLFLTMSPPPLIPLIMLDQMQLFLFYYFFSDKYTGSKKSIKRILGSKMKHFKKFEKVLGTVVRAAFTRNPNYRETPLGIPLGIFAYDAMKYAFMELLSSVGYETLRTVVKRQTSITMHTRDRAAINEKLDGLNLTKDDLDFNRVFEQSNGYMTDYTIDESKLKILFS